MLRSCLLLYLLGMGTMVSTSLAFVPHGALPLRPLPGKTGAATSPRILSPLSSRSTKVSLWTTNLLPPSPSLPPFAPPLPKLAGTPLGWLTASLPPLHALPSFSHPLFCLPLKLLQLQLRPPAFGPRVWRPSLPGSISVGLTSAAGCHRAWAASHVLGGDVQQQRGGGGRGRQQQW